MPVRNLWLSSFSILLGVYLAFLTSYSPLRDYSLQVSSFLILLTLLTRFILRLHAEARRALETLTILSLSLILISLTGDLASPFFFILYLLLFGITLLGEPLLSVLTTFLLIPYFLLPHFVNHLDQLAVTDLIPLAGLPLTTPLALYFGLEHSEAHRQRQAHLSSESYAKQLEDQSQLLELDTKLWLTTSFHSHIRSLKQAVQNLNFTIEQRLDNPHDWKIIKEQVKRLAHAGDKLKDYLEGS